MPRKLEYVRMKIRELQWELEELRADRRKQYFRDYYDRNRERKLKAANERNRRMREQNA